jgi:hypothetical protein
MIKKTSGLFVAIFSVLLCSCSVDRTVIPKRSFTASGHTAYVSDSDQESGPYDIFTFETAELEDDFDYGGEVAYFPKDNIGFAVTHTVGNHDFLSTSDNKLGEVDLNYTSVDAKVFGGWKTKNPSGGMYGGLGIFHAKFDEEATGVDDLDVDSGVGFTMQFGVLQFIDPSRRVFADIGVRYNLMESEVEIEDGGSSASADLEMIEFFAPVVSVGVRF